MTEIAILTPDPSEASHGTLWPTVLARLQHALDRVGITAMPVPWTTQVDDASGLRDFACVLPLLAWGYHFDHTRWLRACTTWQREHIPMANPASVLAWNSDKRYLAELAARGVRKTVKLAVSVPSHTPLMREAADRLGEVMAAMRWQDASIPVVQNVDARIHSSVADVRAALVRQLYLPVLWTQCVQTLVARGANVIGECGPGKVLSGLAKRIDKSVEARALGTASEFEAALEAWK